MDKHKKIVFLHIPKTAGQSVHQFLLDAFPGVPVCPARVNEQLIGLSRKELNRYQIFSGHLDWSALDCVEGEVFTFTILREPMERILSFYYYLRKSAAGIDPAELRSPHRTGMWYALNATPYEYLVDPKCPIRGFIDSHYDNFYTYFFAARRYDARGKVLGQIGKDLAFSSMEEVNALAQSNLAELDHAYTIANWGRLKQDLERFLGYKLLAAMDAYHLNQGEKEGANDRLQKLLDGERGEEIGTQLEKYSTYDNALWDLVAGR